jgi:hypothetical protein
MPWAWSRGSITRRLLRWLNLLRCEAGGGHRRDAHRDSRSRRGHRPVRLDEGVARNRLARKPCSPKSMPWGWRRSLPMLSTPLADSRRPLKSFMASKNTFGRRDSVRQRTGRRPVTPGWRADPGVRDVLDAHPDTIVGFRHIRMPWCATMWCLYRVLTAAS